MTEDDVVSAAVRFVARVTGLATIRAHEGGEAPALPYAMVNFTGMAEVRENAQATEYLNTGEPNYQGEDIIQAIPVIEAEWRFSVHAYGPNPATHLRSLISAVKLGQVMEPAFPTLSFHETSAIRSVPDWINNQWQPRAQMDLIVRGIIRDGFNVDVIEEVPMTIVKEG